MKENSNLIQEVQLPQGAQQDYMKRIAEEQAKAEAERLARLERE